MKNKSGNASVNENKTGCVNGSSEPSNSSTVICVHGPCLLFHSWAIFSWDQEEQAPSVSAIENESGRGCKGDDTSLAEVGPGVQRILDRDKSHHHTGVQAGPVGGEAGVESESESATVRWTLAHYVHCVDEDEASESANERG